MRKCPFLVEATGLEAFLPITTPFKIKKKQLPPQFCHKKQIPVLRNPLPYRSAGDSSFISFLLDVRFGTTFPNSTVSIFPFRRNAPFRTPFGVPSQFQHSCFLKREARVLARILNNKNYVIWSRARKRATF